MDWRIYPTIATIVALIILLAVYCLIRLIRVAGDEARDEELTEEYFQKLEANEGFKNGATYDL